MTRYWLRYVLLIWLAAAAVMLWWKWRAIQGFALGDTDDNIRFAQVRDWLAGQRWSDLRQYHLDPPSGADIHWSRLVDLPIAAVILLVRPVAGAVAANKAAVAVAPLLPMLAALWGAALAGRRLIAPAAGPFTALATLCGTTALWMWMPLRIDHHGWQLACLIVAVAGLADPKGPRGGLTVGLASAVSLTIGLEMLPYIGLAAAALVLRWIVRGEEAGRLAAYGSSLAAGTAAGFAGFASIANRAPLCDALTPVWLSDALVGGAAAGALAAWSPRDWRVRLTAAAIAGSLLGLFHAVAWPQCLGRPEQVSPELYRLWLGNVREARSILVQPWRTALTLAALPAAGLVGAAWMTWRTPGERRTAWLIVLALAAAACALLLWQMRAGPAAQLLAVPGAAALAWALLPRMANDPRRLVRVLGTPAVFMLVSGLWVPLLLRAVPPAPAKVKAGLARGEPDRSGRCGTLRTLRPVAALPPATILTFADLSPRLIAVTHHRAIAGPYHRNGAAILDVHHAFRGSPAVARDVVRRHGATLVMICPGLPESTIYAAEAPRGFYMRLKRGQAPAWLRPVPLPTRSPLKLWQVVG